MYQPTDARTETIENALKLPGILLRSLITSSPGAVFVIDRESMKIAFSNDQFGQMFGYSNEEVTGANFSIDAMFDEYHCERLKAQMQTAKEHPDARAKYVVYRVKIKTGTLVSAYAYVSPVNDEGAYKNYFHVLMVLDLSKWMPPFTSFDTRELFLEQFNNEKFGTFEWIIDSDKIFWSEGIYNIYEVDRSVTKIDREFTRKFVHPADKRMVDEQMTDALEKGTDVNMELRIITARQNVKTIHALGRVLKDNKGNIIKFIGSVRDVSAQRAIEDDLRHNVEDLNRSNQELEEFAYVASHDMQEPLRKITTFSDRLSEKYKDALSGDGAMYLDRIMASAENMRLLINNLLEFSRVAKSTQPFTPVNLNFILHQVRNDLELVVEETGTTFNSDDLPVVEASMTQMQQLFTNIINNSIKFRKQGVPPIIKVTSSVLSNSDKLKHNLQPAGNYYKIQITDNGIGFESEYATRIFQIFQRLHGKSEYPGSGIGLAICKKIVERHGGTIYAANIPDVGAQFTFILPEKQITVSHNA